MALKSNLLTKAFYQHVNVLDFVIYLFELFLRCFGSGIVASPFTPVLYVPFPCNDP